ncbi:flavodoxin [Sphingobacterium hungaricum]|uniref:Flavodoxin n=1 Tax=Sphingobacterium hungaricum TaxID=2082723 RepID=A0A928YNI4_9SPHI|nr:flavodoxin [Sphingobacterium hungaricum]MBE8712091.1 flavodoxin [Sphingobacterium hungaricum]
MKKKLIDKKYLLIFAVICSLFGCADAQDKEKDKNVLIVYLSRTNNTKFIAESIHKRVGGTILPLELKTPYPEDYKAIVDQVTQENESGFLPELKTKINLADYDVIFVGFPTWGMRLPPPIKSFLHADGFRGKTIIPLNSNAGYGIGSSFDQLKALVPNSSVLDGYSTKGGVERDTILNVMEGEKAKQVEADVLNWLERLGF